MSSTVTPGLNSARATKSRMGDRSTSSTSTGSMVSPVTYEHLFGGNTIPDGQPLRQPVTLLLVETLCVLPRSFVSSAETSPSTSSNTRTGPNEGDPDADVLERYERPGRVGAAPGASSPPATPTELRRRAARQPAAAAAAFERTCIATRDAIDRLFRAVAHGDAPREADLARLAGDEAEALSRARLVPAGGGYGWSWTPTRRSSVRSGPSSMPPSRWRPAVRSIASRGAPRVASCSSTRAATGAAAGARWTTAACRTRCAPTSRDVGRPVRRGRPAR